MSLHVYMYVLTCWAPLSCEGLLTIEYRNTEHWQHIPCNVGIPGSCTYQKHQLHCWWYAYLHVNLRTLSRDVRNGPENGCAESLDHALPRDVLLLLYTTSELQPCQQCVLKWKACHKAI
jgi:hypothetical protein